MRWWAAAAVGAVAAAGCQFESVVEGGILADLGSSGTTASATNGDVPTTAADSTSGKGGATDAGSISTTSGTSVMTTAAETEDPPVGTDSTSSEGGSSSSSGVTACDTMPVWWNGAWSRRRPLSFDTSAVESDQTSFTARVRLDSSRIDYDAVEAQGSDLRFVADDQMTQLDYEVESWDESGDSEVWLRLPVVPASPANLQVWMYYGNEGAAAAQDPSSVWDAGYVSVHHFGDLQDSTGNGHTGVGGNLPSDANGQIGRSFVFDGIDDQVELMRTGPRIGGPSSGRAECCRKNGRSGFSPC